MVEDGGTILIFEIQKNLEEKIIIKILFFFCKMQWWKCLEFLFTSFLS